MNTKASNGKRHRTLYCPQCDGFGWLMDWMHRISLKCDLCKGKGKITEKQRVWRRLGRAMRDKRLTVLKLGLREAARHFRMDPSNLSKMERGVIKPKAIYGPL